MSKKLDREVQKIHFKMFFFLLHIFKKHCGLLKPRRFVTFLITSLIICIMYCMGILTVD